MFWGLRVLDSRMQMIFQDPFNSLNPRMSVEKILILASCWRRFPVCRGARVCPA